MYIYLFPNNKRLKRRTWNEIYSTLIADKITSKLVYNII